MGDNNPRGMAYLEPSSMVGMIYVGDKHCYIQNLLALGLMVSDKKIFEGLSAIQFYINI